MTDTEPTRTAEPVPTFRAHLGHGVRARSIGRNLSLKTGHVEVSFHQSPSVSVESYVADLMHMSGALRTHAHELMEVAADRVPEPRDGEAVR